MLITNSLYSLTTIITVFIRERETSQKYRQSENREDLDETLNTETGVI